ncbi:MAG: hypothetical protein ACKV2Q_10360 [Planctomycetaceae bacterium]
MGIIGHSTITLTVAKTTAAKTPVFTLTRRANIHNNSGANTTGYSLAPMKLAQLTTSPPHLTFGRIIAPHGR